MSLDGVLQGVLHFPVRNILTPCYLPELIRHLLLPHLPSWQPEMPVCLAFLVCFFFFPPSLSLCKCQQVGSIVRKDVVPMFHCWHGGRSSCRGDSTCELKKAALQKSVLSGTHALLERSKQLWSRQGAILTDGQKG